MTQKTISLNEKSYILLKKLKKENESYSDLIIRLCETQNPTKNDPFLEYAGIFSEDKEFWEAIEKVIKEHREIHLTSDMD